MRYPVSTQTRPRFVAGEYTYNNTRTIGFSILPVCSRLPPTSIDFRRLHMTPAASCSRVGLLPIRPRTHSPPSTTHHPLSTVDCRRKSSRRTALCRTSASKKCLVAYSGPQRKTHRPRRRGHLRVVVVVTVGAVVAGTRVEAAALKGVAGGWWGEF